LVLSNKAEEIFGHASYTRYDVLPHLLNILPMPAPSGTKNKVPLFRLATLMTLAVCATVALTVLLQLSLVDHFGKEYAGKEAGLRLQQLSWQLRDSLNRLVHKAVSDVRMLAELPQVRMTRDPAEARAVLDNLQRTFPDYAWIGVADVTGKVVVSTQAILKNVNVAQRPWFSSGVDGLHATDYHPAKLLGKILPLSADPWRFIDISGPLRNADGSVRGVVGVHLSWEWTRRLARDLLTPALREYGAEILVVRDDGMVLLGPEGMVEKKIATNSLTLARQGQTGAMREQWPDGKTYFTGYSQTGVAGDGTTLRWAILVRQADAAALAAPRSLEHRLVLYSVVLGVALAVLAALLARRLTRPMDELSGAIELAAKASDGGTEAVPIPEIAGFHEARVLSHAMRKLVRSEDQHRRALETLNSQLEQTVAERTAELQALLMRDALTGLPNRRALMQTLPEAMQRAERLRRPCAVFFIDMDGFKAVNDTYGHEAGDELLRLFGQRIAETVRKTDTVARLAGDEFVVVLEMIGDAAEAESKAATLLAVLKEPFLLKSATVFVGASFGVALHHPGDPLDAGALLVRADDAMYGAKRKGKNCVAVASGFGSATTADLAVGASSPA
jgi:diguanylate cyclase (GGDEF)-like protein